MSLLGFVLGGKGGAIRHVGVAEAANLGCSIRPGGHGHAGNRLADVMVHREDRDRGFIGGCGWVHSIRRQCEHEEMEAVLLPGIGRMMRGATQQSGSNLAELR